jgi:hypothetical protein
MLKNDRKENCKLYMIEDLSLRFCIAPAQFNFLATEVKKIDFIFKKNNILR